MKQTYFVIYQEKGQKKYSLSCSNERVPVENIVKMLNIIGKTPIASGSFLEEQSEKLYAFIDKANETGIFDKKKLEEILLRY